MNAEAAQALLAGWIAGAAVGFVLTGIVMAWVAARPGLVARLPLQGRMWVIGIVLANVLVFGFSLVGLVLGGLYHRTSEEAGGGQFSLVILGILAATAALYVFVRGRVRGAEAPLVLGALAMSGLAFALVLPWLAARPV